MRLGCFGTVKDIESIAGAGYDFIELNLQELISLPAERFHLVSAQLADLGLGADACSWIMPTSVDLTAAGIDLDFWRNYLKIGAERSAALGTKIWPLGCGIGRGIKPGNGSQEEQQARFSAFVATINEIVWPYNIQLTIEPLGPKFSNNLQTIEQAVHFVQQIGLPGIGTMCDLRHMTASGDLFSSIETYKEWILHAHIDLPWWDERLFPRRMDGYDYSRYIRHVLRTSCPRLSVEALHEADLSSGADSGVYLRELIKAGAAEVEV